MSTTTEKIHKEVAILDEAFNAELPERYELYIYIAPGEISCAALLRSVKEFVAMEVFSYEDVTAETTGLLNDVREISDLLKLTGYRKIYCSTGTTTSTLIPSALYEASVAEKQLQFLNPISEGQEIMTDELRQLDAKNVYAFPTHVFKTITSWFPQVEFHHSASCMIEYLLTMHRNQQDQIMTVDVGHGSIGIWVTKGKMLQLYNTFSFHTVEEMVYYILNVCEQLHMNPEEAKVFFSGRTELTDDGYTLSHKYIRNTALASHPEFQNFSSAFNSIQTHRYLHLFIQTVCGS